MALEEGADIVAITEHWKSKDELEAGMLEGYKLVSSFCRLKGRHGGTAIYCKEDLKCTDRQDYNSLSIPNVIECCAASLYMENCKMLIICIYRPNTPPLADVVQFLECLREIFERCLSETSDYILVGDFNLDILSSSSDVREFLSLLENFNVRITNFKPTRPVSGSCIDNVFTSLSGNTNVVEYHISDHSGLKFISTLICGDKMKNKFVKKRIINDKSIERFLRELSLMEWDGVYGSKLDPSQLWNVFHQRFSEIFELCFPKVAIRLVSPGVFRQTPEIKKPKDTLDKLYVISFCKPEFRDVYRSTKRRYDSLLTTTKREYFNEIIVNSENKSKASWRIINSLTKNKVHNEVSLGQSDHSALANRFNTFFANIPVKLTEGLTRSIVYCLLLIRTHTGN